MVKVLDLVFAGKEPGVRLGFKAGSP